jgi:hypothetical protein
MNQGVGRV